MVINYSIKLNVDNQENNVFFFFFFKNLVCGIIEKCSMNNFKMCSIPLVHIPFRSNNLELMVINCRIKLNVYN